MHGTEPAFSAIMGPALRYKKILKPDAPPVVKQELPASLILAGIGVVVAAGIIVGVMLLVLHF